MKKLLACVLALFVSSCVSTISINPAPNQTVEPKKDIVMSETIYSVVKVSVETPDGSREASGSGWAASEDTILTASHVCEAIVYLQNRKLVKDEIKISYLNRVNKLDYKVGVEIVDMDNVNDVCLLYLEDHGLKPLEFADSKSVEFGDTVFVVGFPLGMAISASKGKVVVLDTGKTSREKMVRRKMIVDSFSTSGNSGGPVVDSRGRVVGMLVAGPSNGYDHLSICVPAKYIIRFMKILEEEMEEE